MFGYWWVLPATRGTKSKILVELQPTLGANCGSPVCLTQPSILRAARKAGRYAEAFPREPFQGDRLILTRWLRGGLRAASQEQPCIQQPHSYLHSTGISHAPETGCYCNCTAGSVDLVQKEVFIYCLSNVPGLLLWADKPCQASGLTRQDAWLLVGSTWPAVARGLCRRED